MMTWFIILIIVAVSILLLFEINDVAREAQRQKEILTKTGE